MKRVTLLTIAAFLALCFTSCSEPTEPGVDTGAEGEKLMQLSKDWSNMVETGKIDSALAVWADDAVMLAPGLPVLRGRDAIKNYVEEGAKMPGFSIRWEPLEVHVSECGDMAYLIERNAMTVNDSLGNPLTQYNKAVTIWQKQPDGSWKNVVDMWNADPSAQF